ncbi:hypothetical protein BGW41_002197 [Actinomortierella wolfii]|nr:hypothetical protein BGW41_002197 [Actinomortierella wolfii]
MFCGFLHRLLTFIFDKASLAKEEKRVKDIINDAKRRAQRRRAYFESRLGDPMQLLRISGTAVKLVQNAESFASQEDPANLMPWSLNPAVKIDRFDGRALLDYVPIDTPAMLAASQKQEQNEDGIGNELQFERYHDLIEKTRLHVSEEQCLAENEEEWNELVARHNAMIGKQSADKKSSTTAPASFGFNYGTKVVGNNDDDSSAAQGGKGSLIDHAPTALEEENILDHLEELSAQDRDRLDEMASPYGIKNYFQMLKVAKRDQESRVRQLKVTALNLERTMMGKKPLKQSEIDEILRGDGSDDDDRDGGRDQKGRGGRRHRRRRRRRSSRSRSPYNRSSRRDSPSYEPYGDASSSSRSGSESRSPSPQPVKEEFISEFEVRPASGRDSHGAPGDGGYDSSDADTTSNPYYDDEPPMQAHAKPSGLVAKSPAVKSVPSSTATATSGNVSSPAKKPTLSLAEKLRQRMRQGLDQSIRSNELKKQTKERELELERARENDEIFASSIIRGQFTSLAAGLSSSTTQPSSSKLDDDNRKLEDSDARKASLKKQESKPRYLQPRRQSTMAHSQARKTREQKQKQE